MLKWNWLDDNRSNFDIIIYSKISRGGYIWQLEEVK